MSKLDWYIKDAESTEEPDYVCTIFDADEWADLLGEGPQSSLLHFMYEVPGVPGLAEGILIRAGSI